MQAGLKNAYESIKAFSETDFTEDLETFDVPTLVMHGDDDQIVPVKDSAEKSAKLISRHERQIQEALRPEVVMERRTRFRGRGIPRPLRAVPVHEMWRVDRQPSQV